MMEKKSIWFCLFFTFCTCSVSGVAGGMSTGYYEENASSETIDVNRLASLLSAMDNFVENVNKEINSVTSYDKERNQRMKEAINQALLEQTKNIYNNITLNITKQIDTAFKEHNATATKIMDHKLATMQNEMMNIISKTDELKHDIHKEMKELADKINLLTLTDSRETNLTCKNNTVLEAKDSNPTHDTTESIEKNNDTQTALANSTETGADNLRTLIQLLKTLTDNMNSNSTVENTNKAQTNSTKIKADIHSSSTIDKIEEPMYNTNKIASLCNLIIPSTIEKPKQEIWQHNKIPELDELDLFMVAQTGCMYKSLQCRGSFYPPLPVFDGSLFEWRGALRTSDYGDIVVQWGPYSGYAFYIGLDGNKDTIMLTRYPYIELQRRSTPGILSTDRYVPLYVKIQAGVLTFATGCDNNEVVITYNVTIAKGDQMYVSFYPVSAYGGKHLYCPVHSAGLL